MSFLSVIGIVVSAVSVSFGLHLLHKWIAQQLSFWIEDAPWQVIIRFWFQLINIGWQTGLWVAVSDYILNHFPQTHIAIQQFFSRLIINLGDKVYSIVDVLLLLAFSIIFLLAVNVFSLFVNSYLAGNNVFPLAIHFIVDFAIKSLLNFLGIIILLYLWGLDAIALSLLGFLLEVTINFGVNTLLMILLVFSLYSQLKISK